MHKEVIYMIILASASPRRSEILKKAGVEFTVIPASKEINPPLSTPPQEYVRLSAAHKAREVSSSSASRGDIVIGADTIVVLNGKKLGKPHSTEEAFDMLRSLSGNIHLVYTGYALIKDGEEYIGHSVTEVEFRHIPDDEINDYIESGEPLDKAGAYGVQGKGSVFVKRINGDYYNVVGLPLCEVYELIQQLKNK